MINVVVRQEIDPPRQSRAVALLTKRAELRSHCTRFSPRPSASVRRHSVRTTSVSAIGSIWFNELNRMRSIHLQCVGRPVRSPSSRICSSGDVAVCVPTILVALGGACQMESVMRAGSHLSRRRSRSVPQRFIVCHGVRSLLEARAVIEAEGSQVKNPESGGAPSLGGTYACAYVGPWIAHGQL